MTYTATIQHKSARKWTITATLESSDGPATWTARYRGSVPVSGTYSPKSVATVTEGQEVADYGLLTGVDIAVREARAAAWAAEVAARRNPAA